jgi:4-amino-4-deoxy-L-arabinose transferase-like glycosyltransferase
LHLTSRVLRTPRDDSPVALLVFCVATVAGLAVLRGVFAATVDLRVDEAYYWTWSKESVISYLDHPPVIAWCIRVGTQLFGDTNFGVRFPGLAAMLCMQLLLADIVRRLVRDDFLGQQFLLVGLLLLPIVLIGTGMMAIRGYRSLAPVPILLSTAVIFPIGFFLWHGFDSRVGDSWLLFAWPLGFLCATINLQQWHAESRSLLARIAPAVMMFAIASGIAVSS